MKSLLPRDTDGSVIQALSLKPNGSHQISASAGSSRNATAFQPETQVVSLFATGPVFVRFGDASVTATNDDHFFPSGLYYDFSLGGQKQAPFSHIAVVRAGLADAQVYVSEKA